MDEPNKQQTTKKSPAITELKQKVRKKQQPATKAETDRKTAHHMGTD